MDAIDLKTVKDAAAEDLALRFPEVRGAIVKKRSDALVAKRSDVIDKALDVIEKLRSERNKADKPDVPGTFNADGSANVAPAYTQANRKLVKELGDKVVSVEKALNEAWELWAGGDAKDVTDQAFQKLGQIADKASKGAGKGDDASSAT